MDEFYNELSILKFLYKNTYDDNLIDIDVIDINDSNDPYKRVLAKLDFLVKYERFIRFSDSGLIIKTRFKDHNVFITPLIDQYATIIEAYIDVYEEKAKSVYHDWSMFKFKTDEFKLIMGDYVENDIFTVEKIDYDNHIVDKKYLDELMIYLDTSDTLPDILRRYQKFY